ncbi:ATP-dependent DNA helicase RecG [Anaeromicropila populeti]|uniref:ATP-dependent DNA helicase RecG n=1 Tax=Anaeromicropila populeti TaxID=37658 RepID=A0A1I6KIK0_9FIRM|nr:ATP-dependent DNA helicase RecG [Anaeromicropila populeti]SFR91047.1 ATP-dependent DNA helicase RecG [Anaeromicropila populeti]
MKQEDRISVIKGIGEKTETGMAKLGIFKVGDLLEHYPRNYDVYGEIKEIEALEEGETAVIEVAVANLPQRKKVRNLQMIQCWVSDYSGRLLVTWFNMPFLQNKIRMGNHYLFRGKVIRKNGMLGMDQPVILSKEEYVNQKDVLQPVYALTAGITNNMVKKAMSIAIKETLLDKDYLPAEIRKECNLIEEKSALRKIHFPNHLEELMEARKRIVFDEFFLFTLALNYLKKQKEQKSSNFKMLSTEACEELMKRLPFSLTEAQRKVWETIRNELQGDSQMNRLVQGDVGSGKTIVAELALLMTAKNGFQGCIMVPTEVLAKQHFQSLSQDLNGFGVRIVLLIGSMTAKEKREVYSCIKNHEADVIVGTHALIQETVEYACLGLVVTDEQHRFGVKQREALFNKGLEPHILVMSATPIPRTLALILYGDLDVSTIDQLPKNRLAIKNCVVATDYREKAYRFIEEQVKAGHQAYVICPMVEESEVMDAENVIEYTEKLQSVMPSYQISFLHGKMKAKEKNQLMEQFSKGEIQVLVATTVVEVGVNVPNATVMMIENAERFGLAQLHQLRGRVGRGGFQSYCIFVNGSQSKESKKRLEVLNSSNDGFVIAKEDLKLRGPGDLFGIRQSGMVEFKMADVYQDAEILLKANEIAKRFTEDEVKLLCKKYEGIRSKLQLYTSDLFL